MFLEQKDTQPTLGLSIFTHTKSLVLYISTFF